MKTRLLAIASLLALQLGAQNALNFDGANDYVSSNFTGVSGTAARTVEAWIRTTANANPSAGGTQKVIIDWGTMATGGRFTLNILWGNALRLEVGGNGVSGNTAINDGNWHHVACVWDPTATNKVKLYVDGVIDGQGTPTVTTNTNTGNFSIGRRVDGVNAFQGDIDEVKVWNYARSLSSIIADTADEYCTLPAGLIAYYRFNEGVAGGNNSGLTNALEEVNGANGTLHNFVLNGNASNWVSGAGITPKGANFISVTQTACNEYKGPRGLVYDSSGTYLDTLQNSYGCDSVIETVLTVQKLDVTVAVTASTMKANRSNATYRWLDCDNNFAMVIGGTQQTFTPPNPGGNYAVQISYAGCVDTSSCYQLVGVGLDENVISPLSIYPNPSDGMLSISYQGAGKGSITIFDMAGRIINQLADLNNGSIELDLSNQPKGIYFVKLISDGETMVERLILD